VIQAGFVFGYYHLWKREMEFLRVRERKGDRDVTRLGKDDFF
jgi:hypothetical protein